MSAGARFSVSSALLTCLVCGRTGDLVSDRVPLDLTGFYEWSDVKKVAETVAPHGQAAHALYEAIRDLYGRALATWYAAEIGVAPPDSTLSADKTKLAQDAARAWLQIDQWSPEAQAILKAPVLPDFKAGEPVTLAQVDQIRQTFCNSTFAYANLHSLLVTAMGYGDVHSDRAKCQVLQRMMLSLLFVEIYMWHSRHNEMFGRITTKALYDAFPRVADSKHSSDAKGTTKVSGDSFLGKCTLTGVKAFIKERFGMDSPNGRTLLHAAEIELGVPIKRRVVLRNGDLSIFHHVSSTSMEEIWRSSGPTTSAYHLDAGLVAQHVLTATRGLPATLALVDAAAPTSWEDSMRTIKPLIVRFFADTCFRLLSSDDAHSAASEESGTLRAPGINGEVMTRDRFGYDNSDVAGYYQCTIDHTETYYPLYRLAWRLLHAQTV